MSTIPGFEEKDDNVPRKFYFLDSDITAADKYTPLTSEQKVFFIKSTLLADATVLPTTNTSLYRLPMEFPALFYARASDHSHAPCVSFLFQGNFESYEEEFSSRIQILAKNSPDSPELGAYEKFDLGMIKNHDAILKKNNLIPVKKSTPSSILFKEYIKKDILCEDVREKIISENILEENGIAQLNNVINEFENKSIDRHTIIKYLRNSSVAFDHKLINIIHECFYLSNEKSINNIITHRREAFSEAFVESFLDMLLFNKKTELTSNDLLHNAWMFNQIRKDESFIYLKNVYFTMVNIISKNISEDCHGNKFDTAMEGIKAIHMRGGVMNLINAMHIYLLDVLDLKNRQMAGVWKTDHDAKDYRKRAFQGGLLAILLLCGCIGSPALTSFIVGCLSGIAVEEIIMQENIKIFLFDKINEDIFYKTFSSSDINKHICELHKKLRYWKDHGRHIPWQDMEQLKTLGLA